MKIGYDAKRAFHNKRGLGHFSRTLLTNYAQFFPKNELLLFTTPIKDKELALWQKEVKNSEIIRPKSLIARKLSSVWRSVFLSKVLKKYNLDIYHGLSHELPPGIKKTGIKSIVTIHDLIYVKFPNFFKKIDREVYEKKFSYSVHNADVVIAICENTKKDIIEHFGCSSEKVKVVYQSCNKRFYSGPSNELIDKVVDSYKLPEKFFFYVAAIEPNKNISSIIQALELIKDSCEHELIIAGRKNKHQEMLEALVHDLGLNNRVRFISNPTDNEVHALHTLADAFVFPSFYEGFGIPVIEALFSKTPVITSKQGALMEAGGKGALYIDPNSVEDLASAMKALVTNRNLHSELVQEGLTHIQKFTDSETAKELNDIYCNLIDQ